MVRYQHPFPKAANYDASDPYGMDPPPPFRPTPHRGVDYNGPAAVHGAPIPAIADGVVVSKDAAPLGNRVVLRHPDGIYSGYAHMRDPSPLAIGAAVTRGQTIGHVGNTGNVGTHLHLTTGYSEAAALGSGSYWTDHFDPISFIDARLTDSESEPLPVHKIFSNSATYNIYNAWQRYPWQNAPREENLAQGTGGSGVYEMVLNLYLSNFPENAQVEGRFVVHTGAVNGASYGHVFSVNGSSNGTFKAAIPARVIVPSARYLYLELHSVGVPDSTPVVLDRWNVDIMNHQVA